MKQRLLIGLTAMLLLVLIFSQYQQPQAQVELANLWALCGN